MELDTDTLQFPVIVLTVRAKDDVEDTIWIPYDKVNRMTFVESPMKADQQSVEPTPTTQKRPVGRPRKH